MNEPSLSSWEETLDNGSVIKPLLINAQASDCCDMWGARIETTLLADLSEEERRSLAEHVITCSACAERVRLYQLIEEFAEELPRYELTSLSSRNYLSVPTSYQQWRHERKEWKNASKSAKLAFIVGLVMGLTWTLVVLSFSASTIH